MVQHRKSYSMKKKATPLREVPEEQGIAELQEQLQQEKGAHEETKYQLQLANTYLTVKIDEADKLKKLCYSLISKYEKDKETIRQNQYIVDDLKADIVEKEYLCQKDIKEIEKKLEEVTQELEILKREDSKGVQVELLEEIKKVKLENRELQLKLDESAEQFEHYYLENAGLKRILEASKDLEQQYDELKKKLVDFMDLQERMNRIEKLQTHEVDQNNSISENENKGDECKELIGSFEKIQEQYMKKLLTEANFRLLKSENEGLEKKLNDKKQEILGYETMIQIEREEKEVKIEEIERRMKKMQSKAKAMKTEIDELKLELKEADDKLEWYKSQILVQWNLSNNRQKEIERLNVDVTAKEEEIKELRRQIGENDG